MWPEPSSITLDRVGKRFARQWILRDYSDQFIAGVTTGVRGRNGSGKSTLLRLLAGQLTPSRGTVVLRYGNQTVAPDERYRYVSWAGPYFELPEEMTISQFLHFHFTQQSPLPYLSELRLGSNFFPVADASPLLPSTENSAGPLPKILELIGLARVRNRKLIDCSSGMRQRVLLASALYAATPVLLLDEPTVTLDDTAAAWFQDQLRQVARGRLVVIASNDERDLVACERIIDLAPPNAV